MRDNSLLLRGERDMLRRDNTALRRQNARLRSVVLHDPECSVCRVAWCQTREKLIREALGRTWLTTRVPG